MGIKITGDCHGNFSRFTKKMRPRLGIQDGDIVIVCGDLGLLWCKDKEFEYNIKFFESLPITLLWVQGNHENYNMIDEYPLEKWHGGLVRHIVRDKVILLERGHIFNIEGKTFFTFGGAESNDIDGGILDKNDVDFAIKKKKAKKNEQNFRILNESWWEKELPSVNEIQIGLESLNLNDNKVDYIITHCAPLSIQNKLDINDCKKKDNILTTYFETLNNIIDFKHWYFGHYHDEVEVDDKHTLVYKNIIEL